MRNWIRKTSDYWINVRVFNKQTRVACNSLIHHWIQGVIIPMLPLGNCNVSARLFNNDFPRSAPAIRRGHRRSAYGEGRNVMSDNGNCVFYAATFSAKSLDILTWNSSNNDRIDFLDRKYFRSYMWPNRRM